MSKTQIKILLILIGVLLIYLIIVLIFGQKNIFEIMFPKYFVNSNGEVWEYSDNKFSAITTDDYSDVEFNVFLTNGDKRKGKVGIINNGVLVKFDGSDNYEQADIILASNINDLEVIHFKSKEIDVSNTNVIFNMLRPVEQKYSYLFEGYKVDVDIDNDNKDEEIYFVTNLTGRLENSPVRSLVVIVKNGEALQTVVDAGAYYCDLKAIVDINSDGFYELIMEKSTFNGDGFDKCYQFYDNNSGELELSLDC